MDTTSKLVDTTNFPRRWGGQFKGERIIYMCPVCKDSVLVDGGDTIFMGIACKVHKTTVPITFREQPNFLRR